jgi:hypothetical protein
MGNILNVAVIGKGGLNLVGGKAISSQDLMWCTHHTKHKDKEIG